ncbi:MAG TPA: ABC transporter permease [Anaerolineaceae bacterium]|nr:ABC transporter permease [Anaerolineaceae bacterium]
MSEKHDEKNHEPFIKDWTYVQKEELNAESTTGKTISYWQDVRRRLRKNKLAGGSIVVIILILLASTVGQTLTGKSYDAQQLSLRNMPPVIEIQTAEDGTNFYIHQDLKVFLTDQHGFITDEIPPVSASLADKLFTYEYKGKTYNLSFSGEGIKFEDENRQPLPEKRKIWNKNYLLGTDSIGRDLLTRLLYGGRVSLLVAFLVTICTLVIGVMYGGISGYYGANLDIVMMRLVEILMAIPSTIYIILLMVYFGQGIYNILIAMALTSWLGMAQLVRGQVLSLKEQEFILAAKTVGVSPLKIILTHLLPNCIGPIVVSATLSIPGAIATEAFMSFIGLGVKPPMPSWGILSNEGIGAIRSSPYQILLPSIAISLTMFAFNFLGDSLRDAMDPRQRK